MNQWEKVAIASDLPVSPVGLGTAFFGTQLPEGDALAQLDRYAEVGNLIDTARVYGDWENGIRGRSERIIGKWLSGRGGRDRIVISSKGAHPRLDRMDVPRLAPDEIQGDLESSLRALNTEYIDLYFLHRDDPDRPVGEILEGLEAHRKAGRIRYYGCSNWKLPRIIEARRYAQAHGLSGFVCNQLMWSLAVPNALNIGDKTLVGMDRETYAFHRETGMAAMAYMSIAGGYFAHLEKGDLREAAREKYDVPVNATLYERLRSLSAEYGVSLADLSLLYFATAPFPAVALASFSRPGQLEQCLALMVERPDVSFDLQQLRTDLISDCDSSRKE